MFGNRIVESIALTINQYGERTVQIVASGPMQFYKAAETRIELQENKRTDEIITALIEEVVIPLPSAMPGFRGASASAPGSCASTPCSAVLLKSSSDAVQRMK